MGHLLKFVSTPKEELPLPHIFSTVLHTPANLEVGGNGGILVVRSLWVSNQVVPASEHLPAEGEVSLLCPITSFICIASHPGNARKVSLKNHPNAYTFVYQNRSVHTFVGLALRSYDNHQAVSKDPHTHQQI